MNILITGEDGFIGKNLFERLKKEHKVFGLSKKVLDISNKESIIKFFDGKKINMVFHLAAIKDELSDNLFEVNIRGTKNILEACVKNNIQKLVYSSSASVYGRLLPAKEDEFSPDSLYSISKLAGEILCESFRKKYNLPVISLRYSSIYGYSQKEDSVLPIFIKKALANEDIKIFGDGKRSQDFIYIKDVVDANIKAGFSDKQGIFNVGTGFGISMEELAKAVLLVFNESKSKIIREGNEIGSEFFLDMEKTKKEIDFTSQTSLLDGLKEYKRIIYENRNNS